MFKYHLIPATHGRTAKEIKVPLTLLITNKNLPLKKLS